MSGYTFIHYECYARKGAHKRHSKERRPSMFDIHAELMRAPEGCHHLSETASPNLLFGMHPDKVIQAAQECADHAVGIRIDTPILLAAVMTWPVPREEVERDEGQRERYIAWRSDAEAFAHNEWGDNLKSIVEHVDEGKLHIHVLALPPLQPDGRFCIADIDYGRRAAEAAKHAGGSARQRREASNQAMRDFQDRYHAEVGVKHGLARKGPARQRMTRDQWKDLQAQNKRIADAWQTLRKNHAKLQAAADAYVAETTSKAQRDADKAIAVARQQSEQRVVTLKSKANNLIRQWQQHGSDLAERLINRDTKIASQAARIEELEALLQERELSPFTP